MSNYENDDDIVSESAEYSPKSEFSKANHVSEGWRKILESRAEEMKPGYMNTILDKEGNQVKTWIKDTRKIYIASVDASRFLLTPERLRSEMMKEIDKKFEDEKKELWNKYAFEDFTLQTIKKDFSSGMEYKIKKNGIKFMPEIDDNIKTTNVKDGSLVFEKGSWNEKVKSYWIEMVELYDWYVGKLNVLIDELNYFKSQLSF